MTFESNKHKLQNDKNEIEQLQSHIKALEEELTSTKNQNEEISRDFGKCVYICT